MTSLISSLVRIWKIRHWLFSSKSKGEVIRATNCSNLQRNIVALQVEKRCWPYYHPPQTLSLNKILLLQVEKIC